MKKIFTIILSSLLTLGGSLFAQPEERPPGPPPEGGPGGDRPAPPTAEPGQRPPRGERPPRGGRPPRGERPPGRGERPEGNNQRRGPRGNGPGGEGNRPEQGQEGRRGGGGPRPENLGESNAELGAPGIAWYPILADGLAEAKRTNKPILFMAVASQCGGISGVF